MRGIHGLVGAVFAMLAALALGGCPEHADSAAGIDALPSDIRADYEVFAERCSRCHSLARPLNSGIDSDDFWRMYVARMRRQPGSNISLDDTVRILRYLSFFSLQQRQKKAKELGIELDAARELAPAADAGAP